MCNESLTEVVRLHLTSAEKKRWQEAAGSRNLSHWIRVVMNDEAEKVERWWAAQFALLDALRPLPEQERRELLVHWSEADLSELPALPTPA
jgi:hypothetical protein